MTYLQDKVGICDENEKVYPSRYEIRLFPSEFSILSRKIEELTKQVEDLVDFLIGERGIDD